ncbi:MAG TPA: spore photoproduct lyase [Ruminiclostridium sp.]|nr:spore photoproduct lyase [Ruminiclostridium sp.]
MHYPFVPKYAFFEPAALDYPLGRELYDRLETLGVPIKITGSHNRVTGLAAKTPNEAYYLAKATIVAGVRRSKDFATCKPSAHYQLPLNTSCPSGCEYCYLATTLGKKPYLRVYVNIEEILAKAAQYINERAPEITVFEGAATSDPLPTEHLTGLLKKTIEFFGQQRYGRFRFVTKHTYVEPLLSASHHNHTRFRFSINAASIINKYEHHTPSLEDRIAAARKVAQAGYPLGFIIAPIFYFPGWEKEYDDLLRSLSSQVPQDDQDDLRFELITHRYTKRAKANILSIFPATTLPMLEEERQFKFGQFGYGKYLYPPEIRQELKEYMERKIHSYFPAAHIDYFV